MVLIHIKSIQFATARLHLENEHLLACINVVQGPHHNHHQQQQQQQRQHYHRIIQHKNKSKNLNHNQTARTKTRNNKKSTTRSLGQISGKAVYPKINY